MWSGIISAKQAYSPLLWYESVKWPNNSLSRQTTQQCGTLSHLQLFSLFSIHKDKLSMWEVKPIHEASLTHAYLFLFETLQLINSPDVSTQKSSSMSIPFLITSWTHFVTRAFIFWKSEKGGVEPKIIWNLGVLKIQNSRLWKKTF